jgi:hypothetical protein
MVVVARVATLPSGWEEKTLTERGDSRGSLRMVQRSVRRYDRCVDAPEVLVWQV